MEIAEDKYTNNSWSATMNSYTHMLIWRDN